MAFSRCAAHYDYVGEFETWIGQDTFTYAWIEVLEPTEYGYSAIYGAALDTCQSTWNYPRSLVDYDTGAQSIRFTRGADDGFSLPWDAGNDDFEAELLPEDHGFGETYDLEPIFGTEPWPSFGVDGLIRTPQPFVVLSPDLADDTPPSIGPGPTLRWTAEAPGDFMVARLERCDLAGSNTVEEVRCLMVDDGEFTVPNTVWNDWNWLVFVDIYLGRIRTCDAVLPHDGSKSGVAGAYWVVGTAWALP